jgi:hypothetical protein
MRATAVKASAATALLPPVLVHKFLNLTRNGEENLKPEKKQHHATAHYHQLLRTSVFLVTCSAEDLCLFEWLRHVH